MKFRLLTYGLLLLFAVLATTSKANDEIVKKPFVTSYHSFSIVNNLIVVQAELSGVRGNYIFDTGSTGLILNTDRQSSSQVLHDQIVGINTPCKTRQKHVTQFQFGNITKKNFRAACLSLGHIESSMNISIDGLIGMELIQDAAIIIDYGSKMLMLADPNQDYSGANVLLEIEAISGIPTVKSTLNGRSLNLAIDFGATSSVLDQSIADHLNLEVVEKIDLLSAGGTTSGVNKVKCKNLKLGDSFQFETRAIVTDLSHLQTDEQSIQGVVGLDLLQAGKVLLNPSQGILYIWLAD